MTGLAALLAIVTVGCAALVLGTPRIPATNLVPLFLDPDAERLSRISLVGIRLPRVVLGTLVGAGLGVAGALLQSATRNPLAGPELLGVSAGAAVVVAGLLVLRAPVPLALRPALAMAGGAIAGSIVFAATRRRPEPVRVVLIGVCVAALCNAVVVSLISLGTATDLTLFQLYLLGSLANRTWPSVQLAAPWLVTGIVAAMLLRRPLSALRLGDDVAASVGVAVAPVRRTVVLIAVALTSAAVAVCGQVAFVALLAPHLVRRVAATSDDRHVVPLSALVGAALLLVADLLARELMAPREVPVGVFTTLVGAPAMLGVLQRRGVST